MHTELHLFKIIRTRISESDQPLKMILSHKGYTAGEPRKQHTMNRAKPDKKRWHKSWSSWSGMKSTTAATLHLDDINSNIDDEVSASERGGEAVLRCANASQKRLSVDSEMKETSLNLQEHMCRLHQYSDICERTNSGSETEVSKSPLSWIHRFKSRELDLATDLAQGGSFLSTHSSCGSPPLRTAWSTSSPQSREGSFKHVSGSLPLRPAVPALSGLDGSFRRPHSSPSDGRAGSASPRSGDAGVRKEECAVFRRHVASALKDGRTVWL